MTAPNHPAITVLPRDCSYRVKLHAEPVLGISFLQFGAGLLIWIHQLLFSEVGQTAFYLRLLPNNQTLVFLRQKSTHLLHRLKQDIKQKASIKLPHQCYSKGKASQREFLVAIFTSLWSSLHSSSHSEQ